MNTIKIGFIGVGTMGRGMINNLKREYPVFVYNRTRARAEELGGIEAVSSPREVGEKSDIIFSCVSNDEALEAVLFGGDGLFNEEIKNKILIDSSTTSIELTEKIAKKSRDNNMEFLDAPITGSKLGAEGGTLMFMVGGERAVFDRVLPVLKTMGERFVYCGATPKGQSAKHALNLTMSLILESYLEGLALGIKAGVPVEAMQEILDNSAAKCGAGSFKMPYIKKRDFAPHFMLKLMYKDLKLAKADRKKLNLYSPLADEIIKIFDESMARGDEDLSTIAKTLEEKNNISYS